MPLSETDRQEIINTYVVEFSLTLKKIRFPADLQSLIFGELARELPDENLETLQSISQAIMERLIPARAAV